MGQFNTIKGHFSSNQLKKKEERKRYERGRKAGKERERKREKRSCRKEISQSTKIIYEIMKIKDEVISDK